MSGSAKRKAKEDKEKKDREVLNKTRKLSDFFSKSTSSRGEISTSVPQASIPSVSNFDPSQVGSRDESETSEYPVEKERCSLENHNRSVDIGKWPETLNQAEKEYWISQGAEGVKKYQNKESNFHKSARRYESENTNR